MATIDKRGQSYRIRVYAGYDMYGRRVEKSMTWKPPADWSESRAKKEAQRQAALFEERIKTGQVISSKLKFAEFADQWMCEYAIPNLKPKTTTRYKVLLKRINECFGHITLDKLHPQHLLQFYAMLNNEAPENMPYTCKVDFKTYLKDLGITQVILSNLSGVSVAVLGNINRGKNISYSSAASICDALDKPLNTLFSPANPVKKLSSTTIKHYHRLISDILNDAVKWGYLASNPCSRISCPKGAPAEIAYLNDDQARKLVELLEAAPAIYRNPIRLLLLTGMRRGELLGLEWKDIDWDNKCIHIRRSSHYLPEKGIYTDTPKNESSNRIIIISSQVVSVLQAQMAWQKSQALDGNSNWTNCGRIVVSEDGSPMHPDRLTRWFSHFIAGTDLPPIHLHSLRHTYATLCIAKGVPITEVAEQLGHSSVATTARIYAHSIRSARIAAADKVGGLFADLI